MRKLNATWTVTIDEVTLIKEMLETGEYGIGGHPITEESMVEFFRNRVFGLEPDNYEQEWATNYGCSHYLEIETAYENKQLWYKHFMNEEIN
jgi:hypothetical protein